MGLSIDSDVRVDRGDIVREVLPNTSTDPVFINSPTSVALAWDCPLTVMLGWTEAI